MPDQAGTIEQLLRHLSEALQPLADELSPALLQDIGIGIPAAWSAQVNSEFAHVSSAARALPAATTALINASASGNALTIIARSAELGVRIAEVTATSIQLADTIRQAANADGTLSAAQKSHFNDRLDDFFLRLGELMAVRTLEKRLPQFAAILDLGGVFSSTVMPGTPGDPTAPPHIRRGLDLARIPKLFQEPSELARELYGWGNTAAAAEGAFDGRDLFVKLRKFLRSYELPAEILEPGPGQPPILESLIFAAQANTAISPPGLNFELRLPATVAVNQTFPLVGPWSLLISFQGAYDAGLQGLIQTDGFGSIDFQVKPQTGPLAITTGASLVAENPGRPMQIIGLPGGTRLEVGKVTAGVELQASIDTNTGNAAIAPAITVALDRLKLIISLSGGDGFLKDAIPASSIEAEFSLAGRLSQEGFVLVS